MRTKRKVRRQYPDRTSGLQPSPARQELAIGILLANSRSQVKSFLNPPLMVGMELSTLEYSHRKRLFAGEWRTLGNMASFGHAKMSRRQLDNSLIGE